MTDQTTDTPIVYIRWRDHFSVNGSWITHDDLHSSNDFVIIHTVGYLLVETLDSYKVGLSISEEGLISGNIVIQKVNVVEFKECSVKAEGTEPD